MIMYQLKKNLHHNGLFKSFDNKICFTIASLCSHKNFSSYTRTKMKGWQINKYSGIKELNLNTFACGTIKHPKEMLVKVNACSVNPIDVRMADGYGQALINVLRKQRGFMASRTEFPLTLGRDFSGTVLEVGRGVQKFKVGDEVWGAIAAERPGTHAEYVVTSADEISLKPSSLSHVEAASIPYVAATTWAAVCSVGELREHKTAGKRILIFAASGGVGTFAIQLLKSWGANVTVTCSTNAVSLVERLGADHVIDYKTKDLWKELRKVDKFDFILDPLGGEYAQKAPSYLTPWKSSHLVTLNFPLLRNSDRLGVLPGMVKSVLDASFDTLKGVQSGGSVRWSFFMPNGKALEKVKSLVEKKKISPVVQHVLPFSDTPTAYDLVQKGHLRGKVVIDVNP